MNNFLLVIKMDGRVYMTYHHSQYSMSREALLVQRENNIKLKVYRIAALNLECCLNDYPDNTAFVITAGIDTAIIPMTDAEIRQYDGNLSRNIQEQYVSPFDGKQK